MPNIWLKMLAWIVAVLCAVGVWTSDAFGQPDSPVQVSAAASVSQVTPGGEFTIAVVMDHQPGWHSHTNDPVVPKSWGDFPAIPTEISLTSGSGVTVGPVQWPKTKYLSIDLAGTGKPEKYGVFEGRAVALIPVAVDAGATGELRLKVKVAFQTCDDTTCLMPESHTLEIVIPVGAATVMAADMGDFKAFDASVFTRRADFQAPGPKGGLPRKELPGSSTAVSGKTVGANGTFFGIPLPEGGGTLAVGLLFLLSALGGLILNLTPCVLPVIPLKIMALSQHAGSPGRTLYLGAWMAAGVVAFWVGIGVPVIIWSSIGDPSQVFGVWWVTFGMGVIISVMAAGLMGLFSLTLPQSVYMVNPKADTAPGSFLFGVMTAVLGLPCFGFVAGGLLAAATTLPKLVTLVVFAGIGVGMALPYLALAAKPGWINKIPRTGPASELVKQVMGIMLLGAGLYFIGSGLVGLIAAQPWMARMVHWWAAAICVVIAGVWMAWRTFAITKSPARRALFTLLAATLAGGGLWFVSDLTDSAKHSRWVPYTPAAFQQARAQGKVIVVDFTAEWCINCNGLRARVLSKNPAKTAFAGGDVVLMEVDYTGANPDGEALQKSLNRKGIPLLAIFGPGTEQPWLANAYTGSQVVEAIEQARGEGRTASGLQVGGEGKGGS